MSLFRKKSAPQPQSKLFTGNVNASPPQSNIASPYGANNVNRSTPVGSTNGVTLSASATVRSRSGTDPQTCFEVFKSHWSQAWGIIVKTNGQPSPTSTSFRRSPQQEVDTVLRYVDQMMLLLVEEEDQDGAQGPVLQYMLEEDILTKLFNWSEYQIDFAERLKFHHLKMMDLLISQARQSLLVHKPIIRPLLYLLNSCEEHPNLNIEQHSILVLHQMCVAVTQNTHLLELLFSASSDQGTAKFLIFSLLIPYIHHEGAIGQQARDALLLIMALSAKHESIGHYIAQNSDFCPVLATGLSGLYSSLPRKLDPPSDDWYQITTDDINKCKELLMFLNSLEFCNAVVQVSHPLVAEQLLTYILQGFLSPVVGPALHQNDIILQEMEEDGSFSGDDTSVLLDDDNDVDIHKLPLSLVETYFRSSMEEVIAATAYLDLFIRRITEPALLCVFIKFVICEKYDDVSILESLIERIQSSSRLCMVTLSLFKTLVDLNCEDVMFQLIFRYLIPCTHVMVSQRRAVRDLDLYGKTAEKLLSLKPNCCANLFNDVNALTRQREGSVSSQGSPLLTPVSGSTSFSFSSSNTPTNIGTPKRKRWRFGSSSEQSTSTSSSPVVASPTPSIVQNNSVPIHESSYMEYLATARVKIQHCSKSCLYWSAPYDGETPSPDSMLPAETGTDESVLNTSPPIDSSINNVNRTSTIIEEISADKSARDEEKQKEIETNVNSSSSTLCDTNSTLEQSAAERTWDSANISSTQEHSENTSGTSNPDKDNSDIVKSSSTELCQKSSQEQQAIVVNNNHHSQKSDISNKTNKGANIKASEVNVSNTLDDSKSDEKCNQLKISSSGTSARDSYAESVTSEADSGVSGGSSNTEIVQTGAITSISRSDSPLSDNFDSAEFSSFLLSLKRVQTPVEYSASMEECLNEIDSLVNEYKKLEYVQKPSRRTVSATSQDESSLQSPGLEDKSMDKVTSPFSLDLSKDSCVGSMPKSISLDSMNIVSPMKPSVSALSLNPAVAPIFTPTRYNLGKPDIGPFLSTILNKLETMMQNSLYVNLLLSGLVTRLACYPQPLLRSFLLNHTLVFQPTVKSLVQVLGSVKHKVDNYAYTVKDFDGLLLKARQFLSWREEMLISGGLPTRGRSDSNLSLAQNSPMLKEKKKTLSDFFRSKTKKPVQQKVQLLQTSRGFRYFNRTDSPADSEENPLEALKTKNAVYCALVLDEFLKELAALSQEHAVLSVTLVPS